MVSFALVLSQVVFKYYPFENTLVTTDTAGQSHVPIFNTTFFHFVHGVCIRDILTIACFILSVNNDFIPQMTMPGLP